MHREVINETCFENDVVCSVRDQAAQSSEKATSSRRRRPNAGQLYVSVVVVLCACATLLCAAMTLSCLYRLSLLERELDRCALRSQPAPNPAVDEYRRAGSVPATPVRAPPPPSFIHVVTD